MLLIARLVHIIVGVFWAGTIFFNAWLLAPALKDLGPDGGKVMGALGKRGMMVILPIAGLLTILSGLWLYWSASVGFDTAYMRSRPGMAYGIGMVAALAAFLIGVVVVRPTMIRLTTADPSEAPRLRARAGAMSTLVALLVGIAVICMAVGRYV